MSNTMSRRDFIRLAGIGGAVFISGIDRTASAADTSAERYEDFFFVQLSDSHWGFEGEANPDAERLDQMTRAHAKENNLPYHAAFSAVCKAYPELARSYRAGMEAN